jgi:hypothetical protein
MKVHRVEFAAAVDLARKDTGFRRRLLADARAALAEAGIAVPPDIAIKVVEDTDELIHLVLPPPGELSERELDSVAAGVVGPCNHSSKRY